MPKKKTWLVSLQKQEKHRRYFLCSMTELSWLVGPNA